MNGDLKSLSFTVYILLALGLGRRPDPPLLGVMEILSGTWRLVGGEGGWGEGGVAGAGQLIKMATSHERSLHKLLVEDPVLVDGLTP